MLKDISEEGSKVQDDTVQVEFPMPNADFSTDFPRNAELCITVRGISSDQTEMLQKAFPEMYYRGEEQFGVQVTVHGEEHKQKIMSDFMARLRPFIDSPEFLRNADHPADSAAWKMRVPSPSHFLPGNREPGKAPPPPGSQELARQSIIIDAVRKHDGTNVDQAISLLTRHVESLNPTPTEAEQDPAIAALGALRRVKEEARKKKIRSRLKWVFSLLLLIGIGAAFYFYGSLLYTRGHYTTVATCKVPFGDSEITGNRYSTFTTKSLLGYRVGSDVPETETTEIKLPGENLTVLGFDSTTSKWWRVNYGKGEANTPKLRVTDMYWFVGDRDKTALVKYSDFCK